MNIKFIGKKIQPFVNSSNVVTIRDEVKIVKRYHFSPSINRLAA